MVWEGIAARAWLLAWKMLNSICYKVGAWMARENSKNFFRPSGAWEWRVSTPTATFLTADGAVRQMVLV
jgi:hypothetical protein